MNVLWALRHIASPVLASRLQEAEDSASELLRDYAAKLRAGVAGP